MKSKILITGSTGFVGRNLVPKLANRGYEILEISRDLSRSDYFFKSTTQKLQIDDVDFNQKLIKFKPEIVLHLASFLTSSNKFTDIERLINVNILFLSKILDAIKDVELKLFINTGTASEYMMGNDEFQPANIYAATKTASRYLVDYYACLNNFNQTTIVPYTIYGGQDSQKKIIDFICDSMSSSTPIDLSPGYQILDFIHIDDVTDFYVFIIENYYKLPNKSNYKLGTGVGHTLRQVADYCEEISGRKPNINWGGIDYRKTEIMCSIADMEKYKLDWKPKISLKEGLTRLIKK
jgi:nucleoside-diphosphate-sugar epimerase